MEEERRLLELNLRRETWCRVEADPRGFWERAERRHYRDHLRTSAVLLRALTGGEQQRRGEARSERRRRLPVKLPEKLPEGKNQERSYESPLA